MKRYWNVLTTLVIFATIAVCQQHPNPITSTFNPATPITPFPPEPPMMQMPLVVPLFLQGNQFSSTLTLINNSTANTYADVTLRALDGSTIALLRVKFTPHSQQQVDIGELLNAKNSSATVGSILVMQSSALAGPSIAATLSMTYLGSAEPNYIDEEIFMPSMMGSSTLQGVADRSSGAPVIAISSLSEAIQHVNVQCLGEQGPGTARQITLDAGETLITDACAGPDVHGADFQSVLSQMNNADRGPVGVKLTSDTMSGSFAAFALAPHRGNGNRFFSSVLFADPMTLNSASTVFTGVPVGPATLFPDGKYKPEISMTNFSAKQVQIRLTFAQTSGGTPQTQQVGSLTVPPGTSRLLITNNLTGDAGLENSFILDSDGPPGALMAKFVSTSDTQLREVELQAKDASDMDNAGNHPWSIARNTESTLLLFNHSGSIQNFDVSIFGGGTTWQKTYKLAPKETMAISLRKIVEGQEKDDSGDVLPNNIQSGELNWMDVNPTMGSGRLLQSDKAEGMARNFSCGYSGLLCGSIVDIFETLLPDGSIEEFADITPVTCTSGTQNACSGQQTGEGGSFSYSWNSGTPSVASISGSSVSSNVNLLGVAPGTSRVNGQVRSEYCQSGGGGQQNVAPKISGGDTVWWFNGQNPAGSTYPISVQLTSNAGSSTSWAVMQKDEKVSLSSTTGAMITVTATGKFFSSQNGDITITASLNGQTSPNFTMTAKTPWKLVSAGAPDIVCNPSPQSWSTQLNYNLIDNLSGTMSTDVLWNEVLGTCANENGGNWCADPVTARGGSTGPLIDVLGPPPLNYTTTPSPQPTCSGQATGTTRYRSIPQTISVGTDTAGKGVQAQSDTLGYYIDHGQHDSIQSPSQPPQ